MAPTSTTTLGTAQRAHAASTLAAAQSAGEVTIRETCRSCGSGRLDGALDLGNRYLSNFADAPNGAPWPRVPLELLLCSDCSLLQLRHTTPGDLLYRHYWYRSGVNASMRAALGDITKKASAFVGLRSGDAVLDIGANDGTLLRSYTVADIRRVGFEPASNLFGVAAQGTDRIVNEFFNARAVGQERFRIVTSIAMFYDLEDPNTFVADVASVLEPDGVWIIEMHYLPLVLERNAFDSVCHEHLEYYSLASLSPLLARHGLEIADVETNEVNGGSLRVYAVHRESCQAARSGQMTDRMAGQKTGQRNETTERSGGRRRVETMRAHESSLRLTHSGVYREFGARIQKIGQSLRGWLVGESGHNREVSAYGASTKGNTLLQVFGLGYPLIRTAAERNPEKWGRYTVGTWIPIVSEAEARAHARNFLVLPWHFLPEIEQREREFLAQGGRLIVPLPEPRIIDATGVHPIA